MSEDETVFQDYREILLKVSKDWILTEINHKLSKESANELWRIANQYFAQMYKLKEEQGITKNIPTFNHLRKKLYENNTPKVKMEIAYECKETGDITIMEDLEKTPVSRFPPNTHRRLYEIASVDVS